MDLQELITASRTYGSNPDYVLAGGGNTSVKNGTTLWVKASGTSLASIEASGFVKMDRNELAAIWEQAYPADTAAREELVLQAMMDARLPGETARPSVEALLHSLITSTYVVHLHPALVNGVTCSQAGEATIARLFGDTAIWVPLVNPGYILAKTVKDLIEAHEVKTGIYPHIIFLQNHGVFVGGDSIAEIDAAYETIMQTIGEELQRMPDLTPLAIDKEKEQVIFKAFREVFGAETKELFSCMNKEFAHYIQNEETVIPISSSFTPDHIVYSGFKPLWIADTCFTAKDPAVAVRKDIADYTNAYGAPPKTIIVQKTGVFTSGSQPLLLFLDTLKVAVYTESFGGYRFMDDDQIDFIRNWEVEKYRASVSAS